MMSTVRHKTQIHVINGFREVKMNKYYVYTLIDPTTNCIFYVGKGCKNRLDAHEKEAQKGVISHKCNKIRSIWKKNLQVDKQIVKRFRSEIDAYQFESRLIQKLGIHNLTNVVNVVVNERKSYKPVKIKNNDVSLDLATKIFFYIPEITKEWLKNDKSKLRFISASTLQSKIIGHCFVAFVNSLLPSAYNVLIKDENSKERILNEFGYI